MRNRFFLAVPMLATVTLFVAHRAQSAPAAPAKPNLVIILADDMGYGDIGPFGSKVNRTPNLDRMAAEGMRLTSFYACPVCTPSRAQFMTGCYAKRVSLPQVIFPACPIGLNTSEATLPKLLGQQGYATMCIGKWHLGDQREFLPTRHGFDHYFGLPYSNDMGGGEQWPQGTFVKGRRPPLPLVRDLAVIETVSPAQQDRITARYTDEAVAFIRAHKDQPFFLYLPHTAVHVPLHPGERFRGKSANGTYGDWVEEVDWSVGRVLDTLRELKLDGRTLVIFTSDNGPWLTQGNRGGVAGPLRGGKGSTWEGGVREPTIAWWPGQIAPRTACDAVAANLDLLPTFVKLAGGAVPADRKIDGADIWPLLSGASKQSPREAHYYFNGNRLEAVRSGPWKLDLRPQQAAKSAKKAAPHPNPLPKGEGTAVAAAKAGPARLYNLVDDIGETTDVAAKNPDVVRRLMGFVARMDADLGVTGLGPGVRPPGSVADPQPLLLPGTKVIDEPAASKLPSVKSFKNPEIGEILGHGEAPQIARKPLVISVEVQPQTRDGVIVAQGGATTGYALHLSGGKLVFTVRQRKQAVAIAASETPTGRLAIEARLAADGEMTLTINGKKVAAGKAPGPLPVQPAENFCIGFDDGQPVGDYGTENRFSGKIENLSVRAGAGP